MTINTILCYQTEDGKIWQTLAQAEFWEKFISNQTLFKKDEKEKYYSMREEGYENKYSPVGRD